MSTIDIKQALFTVAFSFSCFISSLFISWQGLVQIDFAYPQAYEFIDIGGNIDYYGPQNRFKKHFEKTDAAEHLRVFSEINQAVHNHGHGLADIDYRLPSGAIVDQLLHKAEIVHLQDVANLIDVLFMVGLASLVCLGACVVIAKRKGIVVASVITQVVALVIVLVVISAIVIVIGAEKVFYALHIWVFPDEHQWYFFYQDSLMSTLMKAPVLFAVIAVEIVLLATAIFALLVYIARRLTTIRPSDS